jgi:aminopeptidase-like protein
MREIDIIKKYYMYNRVANSDGFYESVKNLAADFDISVNTYKPGLSMWYWLVPKRWHVRKALLIDEKSNIILDFKRHPLSLWAYSHPFKGKISREDLITHHIFSNPQLPNAIPFRFRQMFKHWETTWGFSMPHKEVKALQSAHYFVNIDTYFTDDPMISFEYTAEGETEDSILLVGHWCHPGIVEDGLSGCSVGIKVIDELRKTPHHFTYTFLGIPELIGSVAYLYHNEKFSKNIKAVLALNFLGRDDDLIVFNSRGNRSRLDMALSQSLKCAGKRHHSMPFKHTDENRFKPNDLKKSFSGGGTGDEAPFESPGFAIPTTALVRRTPYEEYHTDKDNLNLVKQENLETVRKIVLQALSILEKDWRPEGRFKGLPCLSSPDLQLFFDPPRDSNVCNRNHVQQKDAYMQTYVSEKGQINLHDLSTHIVYLLDGDRSVLSLSEHFDVPFDVVDQYLQQWNQKGLVCRKPITSLKAVK